MNVVAIDVSLITVNRNGIQKCFPIEVSLVNERGQLLYSSYISPHNKVVNWLYNSTATMKNLKRKGVPIKEAKQNVCDLIRGSLLVGHKVPRTLKSLGLCHAEDYIRDVAVYYRKRYLPSLKSLARKHLGWTLTRGEQNAFQHAKAAMSLYNMEADAWEQESYYSEEEYSDDY